MSLKYDNEDNVKWFSEIFNAQQLASGHFSKPPEISIEHS